MVEEIKNLIREGKKKGFLLKLCDLRWIRNKFFNKPQEILQNSNLNEIFKILINDLILMNFSCQKFLKTLSALQIL